MRLRTTTTCETTIWDRKSLWPFVKVSNILVCTHLHIRKLVDMALLALIRPSQKIFCSPLALCVALYFQLVVTTGCGIYVWNCQYFPIHHISKSLNGISLVHCTCFVHWSALAKHQIKFSSLTKHLKDFNEDNFDGSVQQHLS